MILRTVRLYWIGFPRKSVPIVTSDCTIAVLIYKIVLIGSEAVLTI